MISDTVAWMSGEMRIVVGVVLMILTGLIIFVDKKSRKRWERGRKRPVP